MDNATKERYRNNSELNGIVQNMRDKNYSDQEMSYVMRRWIVEKENARRQAIAKKKAEANDLLSKTDWYVTRKQEKDTAIPSAITTERDAIRTACAGIETKITNASDLDAFIALFDKKDNGDPSDMDCYR